MKQLRLVVAALSAVALVATPVLAADRSKVEKSDNLKPLGRAAFLGGTELAASGKYVYAGQSDGGEDIRRGSAPEEGGLRVIDVSGKGPKEVGFLHCPGNDNDVEVVKPGLIALGFHTNKCLPGGHGLLLADVRNAKKPRMIGGVLLPSGGSSHTIKPYPGKPYVYVNPGGLRNGQAREYIVDVSNPKKPEVAGEYVPNATGCHDLSFHISKDRKLAFCAGYGETQIWDVSDPLKPTTIGRIHNPAIEFQHYAVASPDGKLLAIDDEAFAFHECHTGQTPTGRVWIYDISNPSMPVPQSSFAPPRGGDATGIGTYTGWVPSWCLSHGLDWQPGTRNLAVTWFTGGVSVLNLDTPPTPKEIAHYVAEDSATYSALWHNNRLYTNDSRRGVEGFQINGLPK